MKDAGETGARTAPDEREVRFSSERDRLADFLGHKALLCPTPSGRWMGRRGRREAAGFPGTGGPARAGAGAGARVDIMALVSEK